MARRSKPTFLLRQDVTTDDTTQVQEVMDISSFVDVPNGEVLLIKRAWINYCDASAGHGVIASMFAASSGLCVSASACTRTFAQMQSSAEPSTITKGYLHVHGDGGQDTTFYREDTLLEPAQFEDGFYCASSGITLSVDSSLSLSPEIKVSFIFECQQVKIGEAAALAKIVSLTQ
jgi:hypothetical protein|tara:strand:- start:447 stop:971 length:525 start_codon:yes stop_codon:yes gene_type:complete